MAKILLRPRRLLSWHSFKRCIRRDRRRRETLPELWHLEEAGRILPQSVSQVGHDNCNLIRIRTVVRFLPSYACPVSCGIGLLTRLVASPQYDSERDFALAACRFHEWDVCSVDCLGFTAANVSPRTALDPYGRSRSTDGRGSALDSARSPVPSVHARLTAVVCS